LLDTQAWPVSLNTKYPDPLADLDKALFAFFKKNKGNWGISDFLAQCSENEVPQFLKHACRQIKLSVEPDEPEIVSSEDE